jgi:hypothetical protein
MENSTNRPTVMSTFDLRPLQIQLAEYDVKRKEIMRELLAKVRNELVAVYRLRAKPQNYEKTHWRGKDVPLPRTVGYFSSRDRAQDAKMWHRDKHRVTDVQWIYDVKEFPLNCDTIDDEDLIKLDKLRDVVREEFLDTRAMTVREQLLSAMEYLNIRLQNINDIL